jgi:hypothetical protein
LNIKQLIKVQFDLPEEPWMQFFSIFHINHRYIPYNIDEPNRKKTKYFFQFQHQFSLTSFLSIGTRIYRADGDTNP